MASTRLAQLDLFEVPPTRKPTPNYAPDYAPQEPHDFPDSDAYRPRGIETVPLWLRIPLIDEETTWPSAS